MVHNSIKRGGHEAWRALIAQISAARADLDLWRAMVRVFQRRSATEVNPLLAQLRECFGVEATRPVGG